MTETVGFKKLHRPIVATKKRGPEPLGISVMLHSTHESLEADLYKLLSSAGFDVTGMFSTLVPHQRPQYWNQESEIAPKARREKIQHLIMEPKDIGPLGTVYIAMNNPDLVARCERVASIGVPVVAYLVGQTNSRMLIDLARLMHDNPLVWATSYSRAEKDHLVTALDGQPAAEDRVFRTRFGMDPTRYYGWEGTLESVFTACNSFGKRKESCSWNVYQRVVDGIASCFAGYETETDGGTGELTYRSLLKRYRLHRVYFSTGTMPAPMTMTPMEAMATGCPTAVYDNGCGISEEEVFSDGVGCCSADVDELRTYLARALSDRAFAEDQSRACLARARDVFSWDAAKAEWTELLTAVVSSARR